MPTEESQMASTIGHMTPLPNPFERDLSEDNHANNEDEPRRVLKVRTYCFLS
jgi:hypothetical protein